MRKSFTTACRGSHLSLAQVTIFEEYVSKHYPGLKFERNIKSTRGDNLKDVALDSVEGINFFTNDIQVELKSGRADFAVHSLKDVNNLDFFCESNIAFLHRDLIPDIGIFNSDILEKIQENQEITIGTSSPRRATAGMQFLKSALPRFGEREPNLKVELIRGNVDTRLRKLTNGKKYDGIILALAGINRLLSYDPAKDMVAELLKDKKWMIFPLFETPPSCNQGIIVVETSKSNIEASMILEKLNDVNLQSRVLKERKISVQYGAQGCSQKFGVFADIVRNEEMVYARGLDHAANHFEHWDFPNLEKIGETDIEFFKDLVPEAYNYSEIEVNYELLQSAHIFVSQSRAISAKNREHLVGGECIWTAGTKTWLSLSSDGVWVNGCANGLGMNSLKRIIESSLVNERMEKMCILTNSESASHYSQSQKTIPTYAMEARYDKFDKARLEKVDHIFWTSFQQFRDFAQYFPNVIQHYCASGRTYDLLTQHGVEPIVFPTIQSFKTSTKR